MTAINRIGMTLFVITCLALAGGIVYFVTDDDTREQWETSRALNEATEFSYSLERVRHNHLVMVNVFWMDGEIDENECRTILRTNREVRKTLALHSDHYIGHANLERNVNRLENYCANPTPTPHYGRSATTTPANNPGGTP